MNNVYIVSAARTAIGRFGGTLKGFSPTDLGVHVTKEALKRSGVAADTISSQIVGHVIRTDAKDAYIARRITLGSELPVHTQSLLVNRLCGSGLEAVVLAAQQIMCGEVSVAVAGGTESMSNAAHLLPGFRWGKPMGDGTLQDEMTTTLTDPFGVGHMGVTAENLADKYNISREAQDEFALQSQLRAINAIEKGYFESQIAPIEIKTRKATSMFSEDEHVKSDSTIEGLAKLRPAFKEGGTVTAGNASGINDGAAMCVLANEEQVAAQNLSPMAKIVGYARCGVPNEIMGIGPVNASQMALSRAGLSIADMDIIESNEAFAAQALAVIENLGLPTDKTNPNGGAIALGHPVGASGAIVLTKAIYELQRISGKYALATLCVGGGQGIAVIIERC